MHSPSELLPQVVNVKTILIKPEHTKSRLQKFNGSHENTVRARRETVGIASHSRAEMNVKN